MGVSLTKLAVKFYAYFFFSDQFQKKILVLVLVLVKICVEFLMGVVFDDLYFSMDVYVWQLAGLRLVDAFILRYVYAGSQMNGQVDCVLLNVYASPLQWISMDIYRVQG